MADAAASSPAPAAVIQPLRQLVADARSACGDHRDNLERGDRAAAAADAARFHRLAERFDGWQRQVEGDER